MDTHTFCLHPLSVLFSECIFHHLLPLVSVQGVQYYTIKSTKAAFVHTLKRVWSAVVLSMTNVIDGWVPVPYLKLSNLKWHIGENMIIKPVKTCASLEKYDIVIKLCIASYVTLPSISLFKVYIVIVFIWGAYTRMVTLLPRKRQCRQPPHTQQSSPTWAELAPTDGKCPSEVELQSTHSWLQTYSIWTWANKPRQGEYTCTWTLNTSEVLTYKYLSMGTT